MKRGTAPLTARSLTVPCTASEPMLPPGNSSGWTVNPSVVTTSSWPSEIGNDTASAPVSIRGFASAGTNSCSMRSRIMRPPLPWARLICVSRNLSAGVIQVAPYGDIPCIAVSSINCP